MITRSNHEIVLGDDVGAVDNGKVVSVPTQADDDQFFLVNVQGQMLCLLKWQVVLQQAQLVMELGYLETRETLVVFLIQA